MKFFLLFIFGAIPLICLCRQVNSKIAVTGKVMDASDSSLLAFVTVTLVNGDKQVVKTTITDSLGNYILDSVPPGSYKLTFTFVGYDSLTTGLFDLNLNNLPLVRNVGLVRGKTFLNPVTVTSRRPVIERQIDGFTFNVAATNQVSGGTGLDVLKTAPMIVVGTGGNIRVIGKSSVRIFVDDRPIDLYGANPADYIAQIPSDKIDRIRLITNPSAKYDAEGADAILQIYTKKNLLQHFGGNVRIMLGNRNTHTYSGLFFYRKKKLNISVNSSLNTFRWYRYNTVDRKGIEPSNSINFHQLLTDTIIADNPSLNANIDLQLDSTSSLNATFTYTRYNYNSDVSTDNQYNHLSMSRNVQRNADEKNKYHYYTYIIAYSKKFNKAGREINVSGIANTRNFFDGYEARQYQAGANEYLEKFRNRTRNREFSIQVDYTHPLSKKLAASAGIKAMRRWAESNYVIETLEMPGAGYIVDPGRSGSFSYKQKVYAGYISMELTLGKWNVRTGIRAESTGLDAVFKDTSLAISPYNNLIPNFTITKYMKNSGTLSFNYTQRIQRPYVSILNPAVSYRDSFTISKGNPGLLPQILHAGEISYSVSPKKLGFIRIALQASQTNNSFQQVREILANGVSVMTWRNVAFYRSVGISAGWNKTIKEKLSINIGSGIYYQTFRIPSSNLSNNGWVVEASGSITYSFSKRMDIQGSIYYRNKEIELQGFNTYAVPAGYDIVFSRKIWKERAGVYFRIENFVTEYQYRNGRYEDGDIIQRNRDGFAARVIQVGFHYRFNQRISESRTRARIISQQTTPD